MPSEQWSFFFTCRCANCGAKRRLKVGYSNVNVRCTRLLGVVRGRRGRRGELTQHTNSSANGLRTAAAAQKIHQFQGSAGNDADRYIETFFGPNCHSWEITTTKRSSTSPITTKRTLLGLLSIVQLFISNIQCCHSFIFWQNNCCNFPFYFKHSSMENCLLLRVMWFVPTLIASTCATHSLNPSSLLCSLPN